MIYGYARVSTDAQDLSSQVAQLRAAGCATIFREKMTGTHAERPQLKKLMGKLATGDVVIIPAVDRLSRDTTDLLVIARDMQRAGAGLRSIAEPVVDTTSDFAELVLAMLGVAAKLERRRIMERTARGRADAKARGVAFGRKPILTPHQQKEARARVEAAEPATQCCPQLQRQPGDDFEACTMTGRMEDEWFGPYRRMQTDIYRNQRHLCSLPSAAGRQRLWFQNSVWATARKCSSSVHRRSAWGQSCGRKAERKVWVAVEM
jgi:DNA invertase Pin-like site-specific DNA recombinase